MGLLALKQLMSMQRDRRRRKIQSPNGLVASRGKRKGSPCQQDCVADGLIASRGKRKGLPCQQDCVPGGSIPDQANRKASPCQQDDSSQSGKTERYSGPNLPEDIWRHIHSLMPLRDAARAACVSRAFLCSWRCHPNLSFSKETLGLNENARGKEEIARDFTRKIDQILRNHSGTGVRTLKLCLVRNYTAKERYYLDRWLRMAVTPGIEELSLSPSSENDKYKFPCSVLSNGKGDSIRYLQLSYCSFRPTVGLCCLGSLRRLDLYMVRITGDELWCLLSSALALEWFSLRTCIKIICLKIPWCLQRLSYLEVRHCYKLRVIECKAPNLSRFDFAGNRRVQVSLGEALQVNNLYMYCFGDDYYRSRAELVSIMPNLETLAIHSSREMIGTPTVSSKFLCLQSLAITLSGPLF